MPASSSLDAKAAPCRRAVRHCASDSGVGMVSQCHARAVVCAARPNALCPCAAFRAGAQALGRRRDARARPSRASRRCAFAVPHGVLAARPGVTEGEDDNNHSRLRLSLRLLVSSYCSERPLLRTRFLPSTLTPPGNGGESEVPCTLYGCHTHLCNGSCDPCCLKAAFEYFHHGAARHLSGIRCALCPPPPSGADQIHHVLGIRRGGLARKGMHSTA